MGHYVHYFKSNLAPVRLYCKLFYRQDFQLEPFKKQGTHTYTGRKKKKQPLQEHHSQIRLHLRNFSIFLNNSPPLSFEAYRQTLSGKICDCGWCFHLMKKTNAKLWQHLSNTASMKRIFLTRSPL